MDEYLNNRQNEILWNLLADPANNGHLYVSNLQNFVNDFPQSGLLHALLAHAEGGGNVNRAAAYVNPRALHQLVNSPGSLGEVANNQIIQRLNGDKNYTKSIEGAALLKDEDVSHLNNFTDPVSERAVEENGPESEVADSLPEQEKSEVATENVIGDKAVTETGVYATHRHDAEASEDLEHATPVQENIVTHHQPVNVLHEETDATEPVTRVIYEEPLVDDEIIEYGPVTNETTEPVMEKAKVTDEKEEVEEAPPIRIKEDEKLTETPTFSLAEAPHSIDDDVYDEIVGIESISFTPIVKPVEAIQPPAEETPLIGEEELSAETEGKVINEPPAQKERPLNMDDEAEKLIVGNIAATDYFVFDRAFTERKASGSAETEAPQVPANEHADNALIPVTDKQHVSRYDDDTLPYTFLWWLNKTRKENAGIYQPFKLDTTQAIRQQAADELQQQYYENIFHLSSVEELDRSTAHPAVEFDPKRKEDRIIKKFIVEEPHINPPSSDKLDTENKAKKSSEDQDEMVTETLAKIYTDQMLYHKAINTYKKLMLKYPEKSRYFADQIEQLERKNN